MDWDYAAGHREREHQRMLRNGNCCDTRSVGYRHAVPCCCRKIHVIGTGAPDREMSESGATCEDVLGKAR